MWDADGAGADGCFCNFKLDDGTKGSVTALAAGTAVAATIQSIGSGWYRCGIVGSIAAGTVGRLTVGIIDRIDAVIFEAADLTDNDSILAWGAQLEIGHNNPTVNTTFSFPTSYIKTTAGAVTRERDSVSTGDVTWFNQSAGAFYTEASIPTINTGSLAQIVNMTNDSGHYIRWYHRNDSSNCGSQTNGTGGAEGFATASGTITAATKFKLSFAYANDDQAHTLNGAAVVTDSSVQYPFSASLDSLRVGGNQGAPQKEHLNGHIRVLKYYNVRKSNAFIEAETT